MSPVAQNVIVVGAGIGGLVGALELAHAGIPVTVIDSASGPGGKMRTIASPAGPVDAGPTVFTLRKVFDRLFDDVGEALDAHLTLSPLSVLARHHWRDAPTLDLYADRARSRDAVAQFAGPRAATEFDAFCDDAATLYSAFEDPVMFAPDPTPASVATALAPRAREVLRVMAPFTSLSAKLSRTFSDPRLAQLFARYATYVGGSPYRSPALLSLIWHTEASGVHVIDGGMGELAKCLESLCQQRGVSFRYDQPVTSILTGDRGVEGVLLETGERLPARSVLFNGDPNALATGLLGDGASTAAPARPAYRRSLSAWVWTFAATAPRCELPHHNVFFSDDYRTEFEDLFTIRRCPEDPTLYLCAQDRNAEGQAPGGPERFQIIMNAPADGDTAIHTDQEIRQCETMVFSRLEQAGLKLERAEQENTLTTPWDFAKLFPGTSGAIYGSNPHSMMETFRKPRARTQIPGLYLAGGATHPGPGVPMAATSGRLAAAAMLQDRALTSRSIRTGTLGGMSTASPTTAGAASRSSVS